MTTRSTPTYDNSEKLFHENYKAKITESCREIAKGFRGVLRKSFKKMPQDAQNFVKTAKTLGVMGLDLARNQVRTTIESFIPDLSDTHIADIETSDDGKKLVVWLVHPTNYRSDGTPRKWEKQILPTNAIGQLHALMPEKLENDTNESIPIKVNFLEDTVQDFDPDHIADSMNTEEARGVVMLCGIQTNQWPRALDLASLCKEKGIPVVAGGYHVRADLPITQKQAETHGISLAIGEAESMIDDHSFLEKILQDVWNDNLQSEYRQEENPGIEQTAISDILPEYQARMITPNMATMESSRGCPFPCSFCTIRTIGGTNVRTRNAENMRDWLKDAYDEKDIRSIFITDDNFSKSKERFEILEILKELRINGRNISAMIQADTMATMGKAGERFVKGCKDAGVHSVFLGIESVDPEVLKTMNKPQNKPERYHEMTDAWHTANIITQCGFIIGNEGESNGVGRRSAQILMDMGIDVAAAYIRTPLPGSVDYHVLHEKGLVKESDFNKYDCHSHGLIEFPNGLSSAQVKREYTSFYKHFYSIKNISGLAERLHGENLKSAFRQWIWYRYAIKNGDHPMYSGHKRKASDYNRYDFVHNQNRINIEDLLPRSDGPGAPKNEKNGNGLRIITG